MANGIGAFIHGLGSVCWWISCFSYPTITMKTKLLEKYGPVTKIKANPFDGIQYPALLQRGSFYAIATNQTDGFLLSTMGHTLESSIGGANWEVAGWEICQDATLFSVQN